MYHETIKVRDLAPDSIAWKKVRTALNQAAVMIGSVSVLSNDEYQLMKDFLTTEYKDFSAEEMIIAFKKVSSGSIEVDMQHFGKLSPMYLGAVLKAFKVERHKALAEELKNKPKEEKIVTNEEKAKIRQDYLEKCLINPYKKIAETGKFEGDNVVMFDLFRLFVRKDLIKISLEIEKEWKDKAVKDLFQEAKRDYTSHKPISKHVQGVKDMIVGKDDKMLYKVHKRACVLFMRDHLVRLHKNKRDINQIVKGL